MKKIYQCNNCNILFTGKYRVERKNKRKFCSRLCFIEYFKVHNTNVHYRTNDVTKHLKQLCKRRHGNNTIRYEMNTE